jgi:hypothetical protein
MGAVQVQTDNTIKDLVRFGHAAVKQGQTLKQDAGRSAILVWGTLMAKVSATQKWIPFTNEASTDGTAIPQGIYVGDDIAVADIVAGDVEDLEILVGAWVIIDQNLLTIENSKALTTVITVGTTDKRTVEDHLSESGIFMQDTVAISSFA